MKVGNDQTLRYLSVLLVSFKFCLQSCFSKKEKKSESTNEKKLNVVVNEQKEYAYRYANYKDNIVCFDSFIKHT